MDVLSINNISSLLSQFKHFDRDNNGFLTFDEDAFINLLDADGDGKAYPWEIMQKVNECNSSRIFTPKEIASLRDSVRLMPKMSTSNVMHAVMALEGETLCDRDFKFVCNYINSIMGEAKEMKFSGDAHLKLRQLHKILTRSLKRAICNFQTEQGVAVESVTSNILRKQFDCLTMTTLFFAIGKELGWPVNIVLAPGHIFIRYESEDGRINFETTGGDEWTDDEIISDMLIHQDSIDQGVYMKSLQENGLLSAVYVNRGRIRKDLRDFDGAQADFMRARKLNPNFIDAVRYLGLAANYRGNQETANRYFHQVETMDPNILVRSACSDFEVKWCR